MLKPGSVLVPNFEQRLYLAIASFVGIVLLVGWAAINEPARMQVFTETYHARSIENGATLFANNCATCHNIDAKGQKSRAPALDNPMLFLSDTKDPSGKTISGNPAKATQDQIADLTKQQTKLQKDIATYTSDTPDQQKQMEQQQNFNIDTAKQQLADIQKQLPDLQKKLDDLTKQGWDPTRDVRLTEVAWTGTLQGYLTSTIISGRPVSTTYWPQHNPMPAWGQQAGGPLRPDEVDDLVNYILNFQDQALKLTPNDLNEQFSHPVQGGAAGAAGGGSTATAAPVGTDLDTKQWAADYLAGKLKDSSGNVIKGDPKNGQNIYTAVLACGPACHFVGTGGAPTTQGTYTRVTTNRLPNNPGKWASPEEYLAESIIHPTQFVVPGTPGGISIMPPNFGDQLTDQQLADLIEFLKTQK